MASVIAQDIEGGCVNILLHKVNLASDLVTGFVVVSRPTLVIGYDLTAGKVVADPKVTLKLLILVSTAQLEEVIYIFLHKNVFYI